MNIFFRDQYSDYYLFPYVSLTGTYLPHYTVLTVIIFPITTIKDLSIYRYQYIVIITPVYKAMIVSIKDSIKVY